jgi:hypothetical protein
MGASAGFIAADLAYTKSPIILTGGIATSLGGYLPIVSLTQTGASLVSLISGGNPLDLNNFFANFVVSPGSLLISNAVATYPFANQAVAANAIIAQPLPISVEMICPARGLLGYAIKLATMTALQSTFSQHNQLGGLYTVVTPAYIFTNCIMTAMRDVGGGGDDKQVQSRWQIDFIQPLVTLQAAQSVLNNLTASLTNGTPISGGSPTQSAGGLAVGGAAGGSVSPLTLQTGTGF